MYLVYTQPVWLWSQSEARIDKINSQVYASDYIVLKPESGHHLKKQVIQKTLSEFKLGATSIFKALFDVREAPDTWPDQSRKLKDTSPLY